jgi:hypothetical protein
VQAMDDTKPSMMVRPRSNRRGWLWDLRRSAWGVAVAVLLFYVAWTLAYLGSGHDARELILVGRRFAAQSSASVVIDRTVRSDAHFPYGSETGYDGQFAYFIALDPANARYYIDSPAFRYARIGYPLTARLLAAGQPALVPYAMILVNLLALAGGTWALAAWLKRKGVSPWLALVYGLYSGLFVAFRRDLTEPLAYGLVALAIYAFNFGGPRRIIWSALCFALALLTRETVVVFIGIYALSLLFEGARARAHGWWECVRSSWRRVLVFLTVCAAPYVVWRVFLLAWLGATGIRADLAPQLVPFGGLLALWPLNAEQSRTVVVVIVPALICAGLGLWALRRHIFSVEAWALLANVLVFVVVLPKLDYVDFSGTGRITTGVVLAALFCVPAFDRLGRRNRWWLAVCAALWLSVTAASLLLAVVSALAHV